MGADSMKAGGSAGHRLVLSCQGAECRPWAAVGGRARLRGRGTPCLAYSHHPPTPLTHTLLWNVRKMSEEEKGGSFTF